jgi:hypothetical protein
MLKEKKVFVSSTCYDLADLRSILEDYLTKEGALTMLSDRINFPCAIGQHRHDICINTVRECDLFILIIDGRAGAEYYKDPSISITRAEFREAVSSQKPLLVFVRKAVFNERVTWRKNKGLIGFQPFYAENISVFEFISEVQTNPAGFWIQPFEDALEIVEKLSALVSIPTSFLGLSNAKSIPQRKLVDGKVDLQNFSKETQHYILSRNPYKSLNDLFEVGKIKEYSNLIPEKETLLGVVLDYELSYYGIKDIVGVNPYRPADDDGSSWYVSIYPTPLGKSIKQELNSYLSTIQTD